LTNHGEIAPISRAYLDQAQNAFNSLEIAFSNSALRAWVLPELAGSLSSTFWVKKASGMDEAPVPAAPPGGLQALTATRNRCKDSRSNLKRGAKKDATSITGNRAVCKKTGKASISHYCKIRSQPNPTACPSLATATGVVVPAIGSAVRLRQLFD
jgi:hypothetical protein